MQITQNKTLLPQMREVLRRQGYAYATEKTYCDWVSRFIKFHQLKNRESLLESTEQKVEKYLTYLALEQKVAPSTQNQVLNLFDLSLRKPHRLTDQFGNVFVF